MCEKQNAKYYSLLEAYLLHKDAMFAKSQQAIAFEKKKKLFLSDKILTIFRFFFT